MNNHELATTLMSMARTLTAAGLGARKFSKEDIAEQVKKDFGGKRVPKSWGKGQPAQQGGGSWSGDKRKQVLIMRWVAHALLQSPQWLDWVATKSQATEDEVQQALKQFTGLGTGKQRSQGLQRPKQRAAASLLKAARTLLEQDAA